MSNLKIAEFLEQIKQKKNVDHRNRMSDTDTINNKKKTTMVFLLGFLTFVTQQTLYKVTTSIIISETNSKLTLLAGM